MSKILTAGSRSPSEKLKDAMKLWSDLSDSES
jgi:hypothetical protein